PAAPEQDHSADPDQPPPAQTPDGHVLLIIEDDARFAQVLARLATERGFSPVIANDGRSGLEQARKLKPHAITLDLRLPDTDGLTILEVLKRSPATRHIPVHVVSASDESMEPLQHGAIGFLPKPATKADLLKALAALENVREQAARRVLVVEDNASSQIAIRELLSSDDVEIVPAHSGAEAFRLMKNEHFDCVVLDLSLPDTDGLELMRKLKADESFQHPPVVVYTGRDLTRAEHKELSQLAQSIVVKGAESPDRLLDEVTLFLHSVESKLPEQQQEILRRTRSQDPSFRGKKLLMVDDDLRNVFALSAVLRKAGFDIVFADNGELALQRLTEHDDIDAVLMDVMMPVMDGLEATQRIRQMPGFETIPIIMLTAKAMQSDREECIEAGASDYMSKPIDVDQLLAALKLWLSRS
uniref:response regulator n=1 Tax=uncultured Abyssibacter sp. TaxID=2320202 RepID=UPI0032B1F78F